MARDMETLELVSELPERRSFQLLQAEAKAKIQRVEQSLTRLLFNTNADVDPVRVAYDRGFKQGVVYALEALPREIAAEYQRKLEKESDA